MTHAQAECRVDILGRRYALDRVSKIEHDDNPGGAGPTFSSTRMASLSIGMRMALAMKPGLSLD